MPAAFYSFSLQVRKAQMLPPAMSLAYEASTFASVVRSDGFRGHLGDWFSNRSDRQVNGKRASLPKRADDSKPTAHIGDAALGNCKAQPRALNVRAEQVGAAVKRIKDAKQLGLLDSQAPVGNVNSDLCALSRCLV